jgi:hypothetical protein
MTLRGFARVALEPGSSREVTFTLDQDDFALLDAKLQRVVDQPAITEFDVLLGRPEPVTGPAGAHDGPGGHCLRQFGVEALLGLFF